MSTDSGRGRWPLSLRLLAPVLVFALVVEIRLLIGFVAGWLPHPITYIGAGAGALGASLVLYVGHGVYAHTTSPTVRFVGRFSSGAPNERPATTGHWLVLAAGTIAGGAYPTVFIRLLGLPGSDITTLFPGILIGLLWGLILAVCGMFLYLATSALSLSHWGEIRVFLEFYILFAVVFAVVVALSNRLWHPVFGV